MCYQGYTEALWSTYSMPKKDCTNNWYWMLFLLPVFCTEILLVFKPPLLTYLLKQKFWFTWFTKRRSKTSIYHDMPDSQFVDKENDQVDFTSPMTEPQVIKDNRPYSRFIDITFYFYQIAPLMLSSGFLTEFVDFNFLLPVLDFFNFQPSLKLQGFQCPFPRSHSTNQLLLSIPSSHY